MTDTSAASARGSIRRRSAFTRSMAIIGIVALIGPLIGSLVVVMLMVVTTPVRDGTILAATFKFGPEFRDYLLMGYLFGLLPALCFGILFCIAAFRLGRNSLSAVALISLLASMASPLSVGFILGHGSRSMEHVTAMAKFFTVPALVTGIVCWFLTWPLHRRS